LIVAVGGLLVFGGYFVWIGFLSYLDDQGNITAQITREALASATARVAPSVNLPTLYMPATFTPLPPCQWFKVNVDRAVYRECPSKDNQLCPIRDTVTYGTELCIYARSPDNPEWYIVELNPEGAYRDTVFIHESVVEAANPTPTATLSPVPQPTVSPTPTYTPSPEPVPEVAPDAAETPFLPLPTITPPPTLGYISI